MSTTSYSARARRTGQVGPVRRRVAPTRYSAHLIGGADVAVELDAKRAIDQGTQLPRLSEGRSAVVELADAVVECGEEVPGIVGPEYRPGLVDVGSGHRDSGSTMAGGTRRRPSRSSSSLVMVIRTK